MPDHHYKLSYSAQSWRDALIGVSGHLPHNLHYDNVLALERLPIFALIIVIDNQRLIDTHPDHMNTLIHSWASESGWIVRTIQTQAGHSTFSAKKEAGAISDVSVFRYLLLPSEQQRISPEHQAGAVHMIDDQLSSFLRHKLTAPTNLPPKARKIHTLDCHILPISHFLRPHKLACFDMDSTLIKQEVIVELAKIAGIGDKVNEITEQAMRGEIDFATSFSRRVALLRGLDASVIDEICPMLIPSAGAFATIAALKALGYRTALISGGFLPFAKYIAELLGIDEYHANPLEIENGRLTGEVLAPILDGNQKAKIVQKIASEMGIGLDEVVCIGDGANDLPMMAVSDLGLAYHAKPIVQARADVAINATGLEGVLYALGYPKLETLN